MRATFSKTHFLMAVALAMAPGCGVGTSVPSSAVEISEGPSALTAEIVAGCTTAGSNGVTVSAQPSQASSPVYPDAPLEFCIQGLPQGELYSFGYPWRGTEDSYTSVVTGAATMSPGTNCILAPDTTTLLNDGASGLDEHRIELAGGSYFFWLTWNDGTDRQWSCAEFSISDDSSSNPCDGVTCPSGETCNPETGTCESDAAPCDGVTCSPGESCNPATGACESDSTDPCDGVTCPAGESCSPDTGACESDGPTCGDGTCGSSEDCTTCASDCGSCQPGIYQGIPPRPLENVALPATGTVEMGASSCIGTAENPAFMIGDGIDGAPYVAPDGKYVFNAEYCIVADANIEGKFQISGHHVELRRVQVGHGDGAGVRFSGDNMAIVDSHSHHHGGNNGHGVLFTCGSSGLWLENTLLEYNDEDGFQSGHNCQGNEPDQIYIYGNTCNNNRENCTDYKWVNRVVESGNLAYAHRTATRDTAMTFDDGSVGQVINSGSDGTGLVVGSDGEPQTVFLFNNVYERNAGCFRVEDAVDVYILGVTCRDSVFGSQYDKSGHTRLVNSTFDDAGVMLRTDWRDKIHVSESGNTLLNGTTYRDGNSGTLDNNTSEQDVIDAYVAAFGRQP